MAVLQGYADLANEALNDEELEEEPRTQMQTIVESISTILTHYKSVVSSQNPYLI